MPIDQELPNRPRAPRLAVKPIFLGAEDKGPEHAEQLRFQPPRLIAAQTAAHTHATARSLRLARVELVLALLITGISVVAHFIMLTHAGHLWRDEAVSISLATMPTLRDIWTNLQSDSFPLAWPLALRTWAAVGGNHSDQTLRILGFLLGLGLLAALWFNARSSTARVPLLGVALLGLQSAVLYYGDSIRGYGLGMLADVLTVACLWRATQSDRPIWWILSLLASLLCVHSLFHNAPLLFAACVAASAVLILRGQWKRIVLPLGIGLICALTLLPYSLTLGSSKDWVSIFRYPITLAWFSYKLQETFADTGIPAMDVWIVASLLAALSPLLLLSPRIAARIPAANRQLLAFSSITLVIGVGGHLSFLWILSYFMQPWYFLTSLTAVGATLDGFTAAFGLGGRLARLVVASLLAIFCVAPLFATAHRAKTNLDAVAAEIKKDGDPGDLIVVNSWWLGYTFRREYPGPAAWTCIPPINFPPAPALLRLTALKQQMQNPYDAMLPVLVQAHRALINGNRLWIIGDIVIPGAGQSAGLIPPYQDSSNLKDGTYYGFWTFQLGEFLRDHAKTLQRIQVQSSSPVSSYEDEPLYVVGGWRD